MFPRLDAQTPDYLAAQLKGFHAHVRGETDARSYIWAIASRLDDATAHTLSSEQAPSVAAYLQSK